MADIRHTPTVNADKKALRTAVTKAISDLDLIVNNIDAATAAQVRTAIKTLARHQRIIIKRLIQIERG